MPDLNRQKTEMRAAMLATRKALRPVAFDGALFFQSEFFTKADMIAGYWPLVGELDIRPLLQQLDQLCLPVVDKKDAPLVFRKWAWGDMLIAGPHKTKHPQETAPHVQPDLILVPLLAFDKNGGRLGFGGGYYDRTLQQSQALRVGVAFDEQQVDQVPMDSFDQKMDWIVTPSRVIRCQMD